jgi:hypothetical protein
MDKKKFNIGDWVIWHFQESKRIIAGRVIKTANLDDLDNPKQYLISQYSTGIEYWCRVEDLELDKAGERDEKLRKLLDDEG